MRESEFCIPTSNKAVISITPNWYDRRALDTRCNYALYSSLSHLANLSQTSPKVRESLTCDGGLEQLIRILKEGKLRKRPEMFQLSKWQQALLCVVNIGVRGSENVRTRVIEAGVVPITVTILCNALEHIINLHRSTSINARQSLIYESDSSFSSTITTTIQNLPNLAGSARILATPEVEDIAVSRHRSTATTERLHGSVGLSPRAHLLSHTPPSARDSHNSMTDLEQQQTSHTSMFNAVMDTSDNAQSTDLSNDAGSQISYRNNVQGTDIPTSTSLMTAIGPFPQLTLQPGSHLGDPLPFVSSPPNSSAFNAVQASQSRQRIPTVNSTSPILNRSAPNVSQVSVQDSLPHTISYTTARPPTTWDQDVTLCLRLLAYLSKYPYLRPEFSSTYDVPRLRQNFKQFELHYNSHSKGIFEQMDDDLSESSKIAFNVFDLVEKFTMGIHAEESTYWAGVIMRNSCRRHEHGGVRQCAYLECGKWESQSRQFAKCRRCRRTKYCSKTCQSKAWVGHRYWCSSSASSGDIS